MVNRCWAGRHKLTAKGQIPAKIASISRLKYHHNPAVYHLSPIHGCIRRVEYDMVVLFGITLTPRVGEIWTDQSGAVVRAIFRDLG